jgi:hypothetical protein
MEFVIKRCPPEPTVAKGLQRTWLLKASGICDENGTLLGRIERRTCEQGAVCGTVDDLLWQTGVVTAIFTTRIGPTPEFSFTYDDRISSAKKSKPARSFPGFQKTNARTRSTTPSIR